MVWFRRMRVGANVNGNADGDKVHGGIQPAGGETRGERLMPRCRYLLPLLLLLLFFAYKIYFL